MVSTSKKGGPVLPPRQEGSQEIPLGRRAVVRECRYHRRGGEAGTKQAPELLSRHDPRSRGECFIVKSCFKVEQSPETVFESEIAAPARVASTNRTGRRPWCCERRCAKCGSCLL